MTARSANSPAPGRLGTAACAAPQYDPELWFPNPTDLLAVTEAKAICATCPLIRQCRDYALDPRISDGIWGGMSEAERRAARARPKPSVPRSEARCGTEAGYQRHYADKTRRCQPCLDAHAQEQDQQQAVAS